MVSYCGQKNKTFVVRLAHLLRRAGYEVWRDEDGSSVVGPMVSAVDVTVADALDYSVAVIVCITRQYKESANSKFEGLYANRLRTAGRLQMQFVLVDEDYQSPDGWLRRLIGSSTCHKGWDIEQLPSTVNALSQEIGRSGLHSDPDA